MLPIMLVLLLVATFFVVRTLHLKQDENLLALDKSIDARINQLKKEFQQRTIELKKRLESNDLDEAEWQQLNQELEIDTARSLGNMSEAKQTSQTGFPIYATVAILLLVFGLTIASYRYTGGFQLWQQQQTAIDELALDPNSTVELRKLFEEKPTAESAEKLYLSARVAVDLWPDNAEKWRDLAEVNVRLQRLGEAWESIQHALVIAPNDQSIRMVQAQVLAATNDPADMRTAQSVLRDILTKEPDNQRARMIYGFNAFSSQDYPTAIDAWQIVAAAEPADSRIKTMLERSISAAKERLANKDSESPGATGNSRIFVELDIPANVSESLTGNETVFVFAKAASGPAMPLAVQKLSVGALPDKIELSDSNAMTPQMTLSQFDSVNVIARISKHGDASKQPGDIESVSANLSAPFNGQTVKLSFDSAVESTVVAAKNVKPTESESAATQASTAADSLTVSVSISDAIKTQLSGKEVLYVFAKASSGPPMPLAVKRLPIGQIPQTISLSDSDAMRPELKLSSFTKVHISARISKSGNAIKQEGDIESQKVEVSLPHAETIQISIE